MRITIEHKPPIVVRCECGHEETAMDLCHALHLVWCEALRHGPGCSLDVAVDMTMHVETQKPSGLGIP